MNAKDSQNNPVFQYQRYYFVTLKLGIATKPTKRRRNLKVAHTRLPRVGFQGLIPVLGIQPAGDTSHKPGGRLPLLSVRPTVTLATLKRAATNFAAWWTEAQWVWAVCLRLLSDSVAAAIWTRAFCDWIQHANHSATELPRHNVGYNKICCFI